MLGAFRAAAFRRGPCGYQSRSKPGAAGYRFRLEAIAIRSWHPQSWPRLPLHLPPQHLRG